MDPSAINWFRRGAPTTDIPALSTFGRLGASHDGLNVEPGKTPQAVRLRRQQRRTAIGVSALIHICLGVSLLLHPPGKSYGAPGADAGTGIEVALVAGFAAGGPNVPQPEAPQDAEGEAPSPPTDEAKADAAPTADEPQPASEPQPEPAHVPRLAMARADLGDAAGDFEGRQGATEAAGGDPSATSDLIGQIAQCLPPNLRPNLALASLSLDIGPDGRLSRPPEIILFGPSLPSDRAIADRIVQAAILCGPYAHPDARGKTLTLPADFTRIPAASASG